MENILNEFIIEISVLELEHKIKEYYFSLDDSITGVNVEYSSRWVQGQWNETWQRHLGGYCSMEAKVEIIQRINVFFEGRIVKTHKYLGNSDFVHIISILLEKDNLKATFIGEYDNKIKIWCKRMINQNKKEVLFPGKGNSLKLKKINI